MAVYTFELLDGTELQVVLKHKAEAWDFGPRQSYDYTVKHNGATVMTKHGLSVPGHKEDHHTQIQAVKAALDFASLKPGDTDNEYFDGYTEDQLAWVEQYGDDLSILSEEYRG